MNFCPPKPGIDAHHQHMMNHGQNFDQKIDPGGWVNHDRGFHAVLGYELQGAVQVAAGLVVDADPVSTRLRKLFDEEVRIVDHQVAVERKVGDLAQGLNHRRAHGEIGHKVAIHDVDVDNRAATALGSLDLNGQLREVGREDGWH